MQRRSLIKTASYLALAGVLSRSHAYGVESKRRKKLILLFSGNGHLVDEWCPQVNIYKDQYKPGPPNFSSILKPLELFRDQTVLMRQMYHQAADSSKLNTSLHGVSAGVVFTGSAPQETGWPTKASADQIYADFLGQEYAIPSIQLGFGIHDTSIYGRVSYAKNGVALTPIQNPVRALDEYLTRVGFALGTDSAGIKKLEGKRAILDFNQELICKTKQGMSALQKEKMDQYCESLENLKKEIAGTFKSSNLRVPNVDRTAIPNQEMTQDPREFYGPVLDAHIRIAAELLSCGATPVVSLMLGQGHGGLIPSHISSPPSADQRGGTPEKPVLASHHENSHWDMYSEPKGNQRYEAYRLQSVFYAEKVAYLLDQLSKAPGEWAKSVLDESVVVWATGIRSGADHSMHEVPWMVHIGKEIGFKGNRIADHQFRPNNHLLREILRAVGMTNLAHVGDSEFQSPDDSVLFT